MRILIGEYVDQRLRLLFPGHDCKTAAYAKLSGLKNGAMSAAAEAAGFEVIVTTDQEIPYQQNLSLRQISMIVLRARRNHQRQRNTPTYEHLRRPDGSLPRSRDHDVIAKL